MVLSFLELVDGNIKKSSLEAVQYASGFASKSGVQTIAVALGTANAGQLELACKYGADKIINDDSEIFSAFDNNTFAEAITNLASKLQATTIILSHTYTGKAIAPRLAVKWNASIVSGVVDNPQGDGTLLLKKGVFSGKAFAHVNVASERKIIALTPNSFNLAENQKPVNIEKTNLEINPTIPALTIKEQVKASGSIPLTEAEVVVSGGRGLKGPENWGMIEELAGILGAATACSKPVSDMHWRPHSEHVGQTGITIKPNLYIAVGISGAIQHLAGISSSKVIVAINKDPEAPFFKIADYGIVGDAFEVLPKVIDSAKKIKSSQQ